MMGGGYSPPAVSSERWLHENHWSCDEVEIDAAAAAGEKELGEAVATGKTRRIRGLSIRHAGTSDTVITILVSGEDAKETIDIPAGVTRLWSHQNGVKFDATEQPVVQTSDVTGGSTFISAFGVEA